MILHGFIISFAWPYFASAVLVAENVGDNCTLRVLFLHNEEKFVLEETTNLSFKKSTGPNDT